MLAGKVCLVTGGAQGIGRCIVETFARQNATRVIACDMNMGMMADLEQQFPNVTALELNVCDRQGVADAVKQLTEQYGHIDVLVNNAGITRDNLIDKMTEADWDLVMDVNLKGVFNMTQAIAPTMMQTGSGSIITMSSVVGTDGNIGQTNYAATKAGVIAMTKSWAKEFARKGAQVRANCIAPGFIETPMTVDLPEKVIDHMTSKTPLKRMGKAQDIANCALFLASKQSSFITGQVLKVDGGLVI
ncbi:beta-ketoacyl-ACP reductase [Photobacterium sp. NCIMB 13483]|uniref:3-oxoacyl-[acyl-carrier-protein] reductase FabG n=1 Tax=Photobacterium piscicola TaxID=1378299 RepID=A0A1T5HX94_9GAMM|nr:MULTISPECIES: beta-ketoacyl-ACP reductase [Photobacterium]MEC6823409.1 beta-ketoacyl-ACP reductase [Photobacterium piscicola]MEC6881719.1 beta-ketoacyl-ACP reductase [Photobacterium piscicola]MEC6899736.1 beta-ketoacyl-ACP reductase [Photobacterium piscicola]PST87582.1 beta-ketoacyl-ACP reductase [Photobacterium sp. NCIMB 13483]SKC31410.1 3-oxoacyl-[acyl-carrier-protein] reductase FabG [Photobacterium piscicola]